MKIRLDFHGIVAQLVEQWTFNPSVEGSIPSGPTTSNTIMDINPQSIVDSISAVSNRSESVSNAIIQCLSFVLDNLFKQKLITLKERNAWKKKLIQDKL